MNTFLKDPRILEYVVICIQEPWLNSRDLKQTHNPTVGNFDVFMVNGQDRPLVAFFVNQSVSHNAKVSGRGPYHAIIRITAQIEGREEEIAIHNVYNLNEESGDTRHRDGPYEGIPKRSCLPMLEGALEKHRSSQQIVVGDFNLYHRKWSGEEGLARRSPTTQTEYLISMMERWGLDLCLEPGTITRLPSDNRSRHGSIIDLVWASRDIHKVIKYCRVNKDLDYASDHLPIEITLEYSLSEAPQETRRKFKAWMKKKRKYSQKYYRQNYGHAEIGLSTRGRTSIS
jgi:exonuclease III